MDFVFVTSNKNKLREAEQILGRKIKNFDLDVPEIQSLSGKQVAIAKAQSAYKVLKRPVLVEDSGLYIKQLNNFPGPLVKWVAHAIGSKGIAKLITANQSREAYAELFLCLYDGKNSRVFSGKTLGKIALKPSGVTGFGWDAIFIPRGHKLTYAQMSSEDKNKISQRGKAFRKLKKFLLD